MRPTRWGLRIGLWLLWILLWLSLGGLLISARRDTVIASHKQAITDGRVKEMSVEAAEEEGRRLGSQAQLEAGGAFIAFIRLVEEGADIDVVRHAAIDVGKAMRGAWWFLYGILILGLWIIARLTRRRKVAEA